MTNKIQTIKSRHTVSGSSTPAFDAPYHIPTHTINVQVNKTKEVEEILDHVCGTDVGWSWDKGQLGLGRTKSLWDFPIKRDITFIGEKCRAAAAHFKLIYAEPKPPEVTFLGGAAFSAGITPFFHTGRSSGKSAIINKMLIDKLIDAPYLDTEASCPHPDHAKTVILDSTWSPAKHQQAISRATRARVTLPPSVANAIAALGSKEKRSK